MKLGTSNCVNYSICNPKTQCKVCLTYWDIGIVYCTCGHFLRKGTEDNKKFVQYTMNLLSIPDYYIKKGRPHGHRYGKKPGDREYYIASSFKKKCKKKNFLGIHAASVEFIRRSAKRQAARLMSPRTALRSNSRASRGWCTDAWLLCRTSACEPPKTWPCCAWVVYRALNAKITTRPSCCRGYTPHWS